MKRLRVTGSRTQDTSGLSCQCSATEPQQLDDHQPSQSFICTAQVVLNAWVRLTATAGLFTFLYFHLITSKFISSVRQDTLSIKFFASLIVTTYNFVKTVDQFLQCYIQDSHNWEEIVGDGHVVHTIKHISVFDPHKTCLFLFFRDELPPSERKQ